MQNKLLIAGAIIAVIAICVIAIAIFSLSQGSGQAFPTSVQPTAPVNIVTLAPYP
ncbi:hypothetical protein [Methanocella arvoryzae]|uniref:hypothetical protein n=1 Tax=Methanocella arvoryzae TaxID=1175445 RepID=UPI00032337A4|nr:hypothetical protein [Methanocella arvoryzae]